MYTGTTLYEDSYDYNGPIMRLEIDSGNWDPEFIPDMNDDGSINVTDVVAYIQRLVELGYSEPEIDALITTGISHIVEETSQVTQFNEQAIKQYAQGTNIGMKDVFTSNPIYQSTFSAAPAPGATKSVLDWTSFWSDANVPVLGYDGVDNNLVILKGADHSEDSSKDLRVFNMTNGTWTKGDTRFSGAYDISNMITAPDTNELVALHLPGDTTATTHLKRFKAHQPANISSQTVSIVTPFFDFGSSGNKKRLYKVKVLCIGVNLNDLKITASYNGLTDTYASIFSDNTFANTTADEDDATVSYDWDMQTFTVSSPTDFTNISIKIYSDGPMTTANWGISEIVFIYREKGIR